MALLPHITFVHENDPGEALMVVLGTYSLPSSGDFVTLEEIGEPGVEYRVEKIEHKYTTQDTTNPISGVVRVSRDGYITITVSSVVP